MDATSITDFGKTKTIIYQFLQCHNGSEDFISAAVMSQIEWYVVATSF
jgi:hypothetical protein